MAKIVRYEYLGSWGLFTLLCISGVGIPVAILCLINGTVRIEAEMESAEEFVAAYRAGKLRGRV